MDNKDFYYLKLTDKRDYDGVQKGGLWIEI